MSALNWALKDIIQTLTREGYQIEVETFQPCHLWMRWTTIEPEEHPLPRTLRGVTLPYDRRYCFVVFEDNEQEEAGDTLIHTFIKEPWAHCETRWFYFHGTIAGETSPSTSCIFKKHRTAPEWWLLIDEPWTVDTAPPDFDLIINEPWTLVIEPPGWKEIINEPWTS